MSDIIDMLKGYLTKHAMKLPVELINVWVTGDYATGKQSMMSDIDLTLIFKGDIFREDEIIMRKMLDDFCTYPEIKITCISNKDKTAKEAKATSVSIWKR